MERIGLADSNRMLATRSIGKKTVGILVVLFSFSLMGCGKISSQIRSIASETVIDFLKTEIIDNGSAPADGVTDLIVVVQLKNSDSTPVVDYQPTYEIASGSGVTANQCTKSNSNGISVCLLRASQSGIKKVRLTNAIVGLSHDVTFVAPNSGGQVVGLASASVQKDVTNGGYHTQLSVGPAVQGISVTTNGGYKGRLSAQGAILPR